MSRLDARHDALRDEIMAEVRRLEQQVPKLGQFTGTRTGDAYPHLTRDESERTRDLLASDLPELEIPAHEGDHPSEDGWHVSLRRSAG